MKKICVFKPKKKINHNRTNLKRIREFQSTLPKTQLTSSSSSNLTFSFLPIPKFLDPIRFYRLSGDFILEDKSNSNGFKKKLNGSIQDYCYFKKIVSVNYDLELDVLSVNLMNYTNEYNSIELLIDRLRSLGQESAKNLSDWLSENKGNLYYSWNEMSRTPNEKQKYKAFLNKKQDIIKNLNQDNEIFLISEYNINLEVGKGQLHRLSFSKQLINLLFDSLSQAMHYFSKEGFPKYTKYVCSDYYEEVLSKVKKIFNNDYNKTNIVNFFLKTNDKIQSQVELIQGPYFESNYIERYVIHKLTPNNKIIINENSKNVRYVTLDKPGKTYIEGNSIKAEGYELLDEEELDIKRCNYRMIN